MRSNRKSKGCWRMAIQTAISERSGGGGGGWDLRGMDPLAEDEREESPRGTLLIGLELFVIIDFLPKKKTANEMVQNVR